MGRTIYEVEFKKTLLELLNTGKSVKEFGVSIASINRWSIDLNMSDSQTMELIRKSKQIVERPFGTMKRALGIRLHHN